MDNQPSSRRRPLEGVEDNSGPRRSARLRRTNDAAAEEVPPQQQPVVEDNVHADAPAVEDNLQPPAADEDPAVEVDLQPPAAVVLPPPLPPVNQPLPNAPVLPLAQQVNQQQIDVMNAERPISTHLSTLRDGADRLLSAGTTPSMYPSDYNRSSATLRASRAFLTQWGPMIFETPQGNHPTNCRILTCTNRCTANIIIPMNPDLTTFHNL